MVLFILEWATLCVVLLLPRGLDRTGLRPVFVIRDVSEDVIRLIKNYGYDIGLINDEVFGLDVKLTLDYSSRYNAHVIVTDISNADALRDLGAYKRYLQSLKERGIFLITIDGMDEDSISDKMLIPSDIIVIPYYGVEAEKYMFNSNKILSGPDYFFFRQEFIEMFRIEKVIQKDARNILVSMGGSDQFGFTRKVAKALTRIGRPDLNIKFVIGTGFEDSLKQEIKTVLEGAESNCENLIECDNMAELMRWADLAVISSGLTKYETALMGIPSIIISHDNYHAKTMEDFKRAGSVLHLGCGQNLHEEDIANAVCMLIDDFVLRCDMSPEREGVS